MPLLKVTIIPRSKGALGFAQYLPNEAGLQTEQQLRDQITTVLGGRIAEEEFFGKVTTGAYDDLQKAKRIAKQMVTVVGMTEEFGPMNIKEDMWGQMVISKDFQNKVDELVFKIISECADECRDLIRKHRDKIQELSDELLKKNTLDLQDIRRILGERPFKYKKEYEMYLTASDEIKEEIQRENEVEGVDKGEEMVVEKDEDLDEDEDDDEFYFMLEDKNDYVTKLDNDDDGSQKK
jgi:AFG3 family protein